MTKVYSVETVETALLKSQPPQLLIDASGQVNTGGWSNARLEPFVYAAPPADGIYEFEFVADKPTGAATQGFRSVRATYHWPDVPPSAKGVRIVAATNDKTVQFGAKRALETARVWIFRADGSLQCGQGEAESLESARAALETVIGPVGAGEKRTLPFMFATGCGLPTGQVNAFQITATQFTLLKTGLPGDLGFDLWSFDDTGVGIKANGETPFPFDVRALVQQRSVASTPVLVRELLGFRVRVYKQGDALTKDLRRDRVNLLVDDENRILEIGFF